MLIHWFWYRINVFALFLGIISMQVMATENISGGFHDSYSLCSSWLTFWMGSSLRGTSLQWKMQMIVPLKIRILFCMCLTYVTWGTEAPNCHLQACIQTPWYVCMHRSICFDGDPESVFLKTTNLQFFIVTCTGYWILLVFLFTILLFM